MKQVPTPVMVPKKKTSSNSYPPSTQTPKLITVSTIPHLAKILTKYMRLDFVEEMLSQMIAMVA